MRKKLVLGCALVVLFAVGSVGVVLADELDPDNRFFQGNAGSQTTSVFEPCPADDFPDFNFDIDPYSGDILTGDTRTVIRCVVLATSGGKGKKGIQVDLTGDILNADGSVFYELPAKTGMTNSHGRRGFSFPGTQGLGASITGVVSGDQEVSSVKATCSMATRRPCVQDAETLCLRNDRFQVEVDWRDFDGSTGAGMVMDSDFDSGSFYFFSPNNTELLVQVLNACGDFDRYWVFAGGLTNVEVELTVTDTHTGESRAYGNPLNTPFQPIQDTSAFSTCP